MRKINLKSENVARNGQNANVFICRPLLISHVEVTTMLKEVEIFLSDLPDVRTAFSL